MTPGWRLASGLVALAAVMGILVAALSSRTGDADRSTGVHPSMYRPWVACVGEVRALSSGRRAQVVGPTSAEWDPSGAFVDLTGALRGEQGDRPFGCRAVLADGVWRVARVAFGW